MLVSTQTFEVSSLGVRRRFWGLYGRSLFIHVVRQQGDGTARETTAGTVMLLPGRGAYRGHLEPSDEVSWSLVVEFDGRVHPCTKVVSEHGQLAIAPVAKAVVGALCDGVDRAVAVEDGRACTSDVEALFAFLRSEGLPIPTIDLAAEPCIAPSLVRLQRAIDTALSQTDGRPMLVDVENGSGLSSRTLQRAMPTPARSWSDHGRRHRRSRASSASRRRTRSAAP
jgi:hypothetical protein